MARHRPDLISTNVTSGVVYEAYGPVPTATRREAEEMMAHLADLAPADVVSTRVKVKNDVDRDPGETSLAQGSMDVSGIELRAEAAGATTSSALHAVGDRLESKLAMLADRMGGGESSSQLWGSWTQRHDGSSGPGFHDRPPERRTVVRRKMYSPLDRLSVREALFNLVALDYRFFVFTDAADDKTSIVYRDMDGPALRKIDGSRSTARLPEGLDIDAAEPPSTTLADAVSLLNSNDMPFVFFRDRDRGRASILYRRYDGHYGLLVPSTGSSEIRRFRTGP